MKNKKLLLLAISIFSLVSCGRGTSNQTTSTQTDTTSEKTKPVFTLNDDKYYVGVDKIKKIDFGLQNCTIDDVSFLSLDTNIAEVSADGTILGISSGTTEITVNIVGLDEISIPVFVYDASEDAMGIWTYSCDDYSVEAEFTNKAIKDGWHNGSWELIIKKTLEGVTDIYEFEYWYGYESNGSISGIGTHWDEENSTIVSSDRTEVLKYDDENVSYLTLSTEFDNLDLANDQMDIYLGTQMSFYEETEDGKIVDWTSVIGSYYRPPEGVWGFSHGVGVTFTRK